MKGLVAFCCLAALCYVQESVTVPVNQGTGSCPRGWDNIGDVCYFSSNYKTDWQSARSACKFMHPSADLSSFSNEEEQSYLTKDMAWQLWIGLNSIKEEGVWVWPDGTPTDYTPWDENEPNLLNEEKCTELVLKYVQDGEDGGKFNNNKCFVKRHFGCKMPQTNGECPNSPRWGSLGDNCYYMSDFRETWERAQKHCQTLNSQAHLASLHNEEELKYFVAKLHWQKWIGLNSRKQISEWEWTDGTPKKWENWSENEPNLLDQERCVELVLQPKLGPLGGNWNNLGCSAERHFSCKVDLNRRRPPPPSATAVPPPPPPPVATQKPITTVATTTAAPVPAGMCPGIKPIPGFKVTCYSKLTQQTFPCEQPQPVGIECKYECQEFYNPSGSFGVTFTQCQANGQWRSLRSFGCVPVCGKVSLTGTTQFITNGTPTKRGEWPWHTGIYVQKNTILDYQCGATLISTMSVLTAAHCVTSDPTSTQSIDVSLLRLGFGKQYRHVEDASDPYVQYIEAYRIIIHPDYNPSGESDIAIIILKKHVTLNLYVRPACFPHFRESVEEQTQLEPGNVGVVVGWGRDESTGTLSSELKMAKLPVVSRQVCRDSLDLSLVHLARLTSYCAGNRSDVNVCRGDSGGGMVFASGSDLDRKYYLQGVVSFGILKSDKITCDTQKYSFFTRVGYFGEWISRNLAEAELEIRR